MAGLKKRLTLSSTSDVYKMSLGDFLFGKIVEGLGRLPHQHSSEKEVVHIEEHRPLQAQRPDPMSRKLIDAALSIGVRAIDGHLTCAEGKRFGIFAAAVYLLQFSMKLFKPGRYLEKDGRFYR